MANVLYSVTSNEKWHFNDCYFYNLFICLSLYTEEPHLTQSLRLMGIQYLFIVI